MKDKPILCFPIASIVTLKSGGPAMTVESSLPEKTLCIWFDQDQQLHRGEFNTLILDTAPPHLSP